MEHLCDNCEKTLERHMFCSSLCKIQYHRGQGSVTKGNETGSKKDESVTKRNKPYNTQMCSKHSGSMKGTCGCE